MLVKQPKCLLEHLLKKSYSWTHQLKYRGVWKSLIHLWLTECLVNRSLLIGLSFNPYMTLSQLFLAIKKNIILSCYIWFHLGIRWPREGIKHWRVYEILFLVLWSDPITMKTKQNETKRTYIYIASATKRFSQACVNRLSTPSLLTALSLSLPCCYWTWGSPSMLQVKSGHLF